MHSFECRGYMTGLSADINQLREENPPAKLRGVVENTDVRGTIELQVTAGAAAAAAALQHHCHCIS